MLPPHLPRQADLGQNRHAQAEGAHLMGLVHPLRQVVAPLKLSGHLCRSHGLVLGQILGILPLEVLPALLGVGLPAEVAISCGLLVLWLAKRQGLRDGTWTAIE